MLRSFGIAAKLALAIALFALPVGFTIYKLYESQQIAIDFGDKEAQGNAYLGLLRKAHGDLLNGADKAGIAATINEAEAKFGDGMQSAELAGKAAAAVEGSDPVAAAGAIRALITRMGDKSNLILDPDLDSYYVMDLVLLKVPDLMDRVAEIAAYVRGHAQAAEGGYTINDVAGLLKLDGGFKSVVSGAAGSLDSAYNGSKDNLNDLVDILPDRLGKSNEAMIAAINAFTDSYMKSELAGEAGKLDVAALDAAEKNARAAIQAFGDANDAALAELLDARIGSFVTDRIWTFSWTALLFVLAIAATVLFIRHFVTRPVVDLAGIMDELTKDRTDIMVPMVGRGDELGRMARAVATFRDGISRRLDLERAAKAEAERREARIREIQSLCTDFDQTFVTTVASMMGIAGDLTQESQVMSEAA